MWALKPVDFSTHFDAGLKARSPRALTVRLAALGGAGGACPHYTVGEPIALFLDGIPADAARCYVRWRTELYSDRLRRNRTWVVLWATGACLPSI